MKKKSASVILAVFFVVQIVSIPHVTSAETFPLNPATRVSINQSQICIKNLCSIISLGLLMYKLDAIKGYRKPDIIEEYGDYIRTFSDIQFDLDHMNIGKASFVRYYPFSIRGESFIMRIFLAVKNELLPQVEVLYEGSAQSRYGEITFQILPGVNRILEDCDIKPHAFRYPSEVNSSP